MKSAAPPILTKIPSKAKGNVSSNKSIVDSSELLNPSEFIEIQKLSEILETEEGLIEEEPSEEDLSD